MTVNGWHEKGGGGDSFIAEMNVQSLGTVLVEGNTLLMSNAEHIEHTFCTNFFMSLVLQHLYRVKII